MKRIFLLALVALMSVGLTACGGKSNEEKAQEINAEYSQLAKEVNSMGYPSEYWSEAKLNSYIDKLNRMEALEKQVDNEDGIYRTGTNQDKINRLRSAAREALRKKRAQTSKRDQMQELEALDAKFRQKGRELVAMGVVSQSWTDEKLNQYVTKSDEVLELNLQCQIMLRTLSGYTSSSKRSVMNDYKENYSAVKLLKESAEMILKNRIANAG